jgi:hypothetical protein
MARSSAVLDHQFDTTPGGCVPEHSGGTAGVLSPLPFTQHVAADWHILEAGRCPGPVQPGSSKLRSQSGQ